MATRLDFSAVHEASYRLDGTHSQWLEGILGTLEPLLGRRLLAHTYDAAGPTLYATMSDFVATPDFQQHHEEWLRSNVRPDPAVLARLCRDFEVLTLRRMLGMDQAFREYAEQLLPGYATAGVRDILALNTLDPTRKGCVVFAGASQTWNPRRGEIARVRRVLAHMGAGYRLRQKVQGLESDRDGEAVLDPEGHVQHAEAPAKDEESRLALRVAAVALERSRGPLGRSDPDAAFVACQALTSARWSLVDRFERDGRRYLVAYRNTSEVAPRPALSPREQLVVEHARLGRGNKAIAYQLGISVGAVAAYLHRAFAKLGVSSRVELIAKTTERP